MVDATRDMILDYEDLDLVKVTVPKWRLDVYIKQMSGRNADQYVEMTAHDEGLRRNIKPILLCVCNKDGEPLFNADDLDALYDKNAQALAWLANKVLEINFKSNDDLEKDAKN